MFTQLDPSLPVHVLDRGRGQAVGVIDCGPEHNLIWVTALDDNGEIWCAPNPQVRFQKNWTLGRHRIPAADKPSAAPTSKTLASHAITSMSDLHETETVQC